MRDTTNWVCELTQEEGEAIIKLLDTHECRDQHFDSNCPICRATSRISLGRDYGARTLLPDTKEEIKKSFETPLRSNL